ncbi:MarR family winged helix-turn-helix transcriptional regulator [Anaerolentibacter hominis]|uniref:MarR family winged helix-turn-helix transcriptional regulator n=1 Tax=Anaerolentibacter hominis TaxID=3079009 RepID=UPI0031B848DF
MSLKLDVTQEEFFFGSILRLSNQIQTICDNQLEEITLKQWFLLVLISGSQKGGGYTYNEIAALSGTTRQNVKKMLESLRKKGFVSIEPSETDGRAVNVSLLEKSYLYFRELEEYGDELLGWLFHDIAKEDMEVVCRVFLRIFETIDKEKSDITFHREG